MLLVTLNHPYAFECENIIRIFFPMEKVTVSDALPAGSTDEALFITRRTLCDAGAEVFASAAIGGRTAQCTRFVAAGDGFDASCEHATAGALRACLTELTGYVSSWGILTGVRPSKLMRTRTQADGEAAAFRYFQQELEVSQEKTKLAHVVARAEAAVVALSERNSVSQYVSIPFCPTRCSYCSFVSHSITQAAKLIPDYTRLLCEELAANAAYTKELSLQTETIYIGGGTPTSFSAADLAKITDAVRQHNDLARVREYTVEAGRPDTIDPEKLAVLRAAGVNRISVNPQTFNAQVLENIGRRHTPADILRAFQEARDAGFKNINMDLIAGLPGDSEQGFQDSLERAIALAPENITVHTLALKRSSALVTENAWGAAAKGTAAMLQFAQEKLTANGYHPYYMYRQAKSVGNLENVGWCKAGFEGLYNVFMMEEIHTVLAAGGGAVTKLKDPDSPFLERIFNFKYPYEYVRRFPELLQRKERIRSFYAGISGTPD